MRNTALIVEHALTQGISSQPPHMRRPGQVQDAVNTEFTIARGAQKRNPTRFRWSVSSPPSSNEGVIHPLVRDQNEAYIVLTHKGGPTDPRIIEVFDLDGTAATVEFPQTVQSYLNLNNTPSTGFVFTTQLDFTVIVNTGVDLAVTFTPFYTVTQAVTTNEQRARWTPGINAYFFVSGPDEYWQYNPTPGTYCQRGSADGGPTDGDGGAAWGVPTGEYAKVGQTLTATLACARQNITDTGATFTTGTKTLVKAGAFADYRFQLGDSIKITGGTSVTLGWYTIASRDSDDQITLDDEIAGGGSPTDVDFSYIGTEYELNWAITSSTPVGATMDDTAAIMQAEFHKINQVNANRILIRWVAEAAPRTGYFVVTSPYKGSGAELIDFIAHGGGGGNMVANNRPFDPDYTTVAGTGSVPHVPEDQSATVASRWSQVPPPGATDAGIDIIRMPVVMKRVSIDPLRFEIERMPVVQRQAGDNLTNPSPDIFKAAQMSGLITSGVRENDGLPAGDPSPAIVTSVAHGLITDDIVQITQAPQIPGRRSIEKVDDDRFKVININTGNPVQVTQAEANDINAGVWTKNSIPISDAFFFADRFWLVAGEFVASGQSGDLFNFYLAEPPQVLDSDPIERRVSASQLSVLNYALPARRSIILFANNGQQFELTSADAVTPTSVSVDATTNHPSMPVRPVAVDSSVYFVSPNGDFSALSEYIVEEQGLTFSVGNMSGHADKVVPSGITRIVDDPVRNQIFMFSRGTREFYSFREFWRGREQIQAAWTKYTLAEGLQILDACRIRDEVFMLIRQGTAWWFESMALGETQTPDGFSFLPMLDRWVSLTGVHDAGTTTWTLPVANAGYNTAILPNGTVIPLSVTGTTATATGDFSGAAARVGASYQARVELTRPFYRGEDGIPDIDTRPSLGNLLVATLGDADYQVSVVSDVETKTLAPETVDYINSIEIGSRLSPDLGVTLVNDGPRRVVFSGVSWRTERSEDNW